MSRLKSVQEIYSKFTVIYIGAKDVKNIEKLPKIYYYHYELN